jgi:signal transduction histidine kinase
MVPSARARDMLRTVATASAWYRRLSATLPGPPAGESAEARVAARLRVALTAGAVGSGLGAVSNLVAGREWSPSVLAGLCAVCLLSLALLRRGRVRLAAALSLPGMVAAIGTLLMIGLGIHDRAALLFPVVILAAALVDDRRILLATTALCVLTVFGVVWLQRATWRDTVGIELDWLPFVDSTIILVVTAFAARLLVSESARSRAAQRESERHLAAANRELEARNAELERFTYVVSHDLKSPLVTVRGFLSYVERDAQSGRLDRVESDLARIRAATDRMAQLLDDLLELSRSGRIDRPPEDVPFADVVREARALTAGRLSARGVVVEVEEPLPVVRGDRRWLAELVQNLLDNAAKFMGGQPEPAVWIGARDAAGTLGQVTLYVRDNGVGIDLTQQDRVFELFHRLDPRVEGTGLGLAVARRVVETHGGRIWVESAGAGRGSTFCFTLPVAGSPPAAGAAA